MKVESTKEYELNYKFYIEGVKGRGDEVIKELEKRGGKNTHGLSGEENVLYLLDESNNIVQMDDTDLAYGLVKYYVKEIKLPEVENSHA